MLLTHASLDNIILLLNTFGISRRNIRLQFYSEMSYNLTKTSIKIVTVVRVYIIVVIFSYEATLGLLLSRHDLTGLQRHLKLQYEIIHIPLHCTSPCTPK
jgi:hypothetical protein